MGYGFSSFADPSLTFRTSSLFRNSLSPETGTSFVIRQVGVVMSKSDVVPVLAEPPFDHFGVLAPLYERFIRPPDVGLLRDLCAFRPADRLLDVGGGTGRVSQYFRGDVAQVCIVDVSAGMVREALAKGGFCASLGVAERLPFQDGAFERIIAVDSFHHFRDHARAAGELARVLAPGGRLVIEEPDVRRFIVKLVALGETLTLMRSRFRPPDALMHFFDAPGLRVTLHENESPNFWVVVEKEESGSRGVGEGVSRGRLFS